MTDTFDKEYFEDETAINGLKDYFNKQKIGCIEVADRLERLVPLEPGADILEAGCAYGQNVNALNQRGYFATGFDISDYTIKTGKEKMELDPLEIFKADLESPDFLNRIKFDFEDDKFDLIFKLFIFIYSHYILSIISFS